jgi:hypothetical protein
MLFSAGTRLGPYEILGPLGKGGMGQHKDKSAHHLLPRCAQVRKEIVDHADLALTT